MQIIPTIYNYFRYIWIGTTFHRISSVGHYTALLNFDGNVKFYDCLVSGLSEPCWKMLLTDYKPQHTIFVLIS